MYSLLESFPTTKQYLVILKSLMLLQKNTLFIKCLICKQNIFKYAFALNMRLLLLHFITCNIKLIVFPVAVVCTNNLFQQTGMTDEELNLDKNN